MHRSRRSDASTRTLPPPTVDMLDHGAVAKNCRQQMYVSELSRTQRSTEKIAEATFGQYGGETCHLLRQQLKFLEAIEREHQRRATEAIRFAVTDSTARHQQA